MQRDFKYRLRQIVSDRQSKLDDIFKRASSADATSLGTSSSTFLLTHSPSSAALPPAARTPSFAPPLTPETPANSTAPAGFFTASQTSSQHPQAPGPSPMGATALAPQRVPGPQAGGFSRALGATFGSMGQGNEPEKPPTAAAAGFASISQSGLIGGAQGSAVPLALERTAPAAGDGKMPGVLLFPCPSTAIVSAFRREATGLVFRVCAWVCLGVESLRPSRSCDSVNYVSRSPSLLAPDPNILRFVAFFIQNAAPCAPFPFDLS